MHISILEYVSKFTFFRSRSSGHSRKLDEFVKVFQIRGTTRFPNLGSKKLRPHEIRRLCLSCLEKYFTGDRVTRRGRPTVKGASTEYQGIESARARDASITRPNCSRAFLHRERLVRSSYLPSAPTPIRWERTRVRKMRLPSKRSNPDRNFPYECQCCEQYVACS